MKNISQDIPKLIEECGLKFMKTQIRSLSIWSITELRLVIMTMIIILINLLL